MYNSSQSTKNGKEKVKKTKQYKVEWFGYGEIDITEVIPSEVIPSEVIPSNKIFSEDTLQSLQK